MKIAIAKKYQAGDGWEPMFTDFMLPEDIRNYVRELLETEESTLREIKRCTMNRTVLDMVRSEGLIVYEDVFVWREDRKRLVPLLELHTEDWLSQTRLGTLFERGEL